MGYILPKGLQEQQKLFNVLLEWRSPVPVSAEISELIVKVGEITNYHYDVSAHWEFWGPDNNKIQFEEIENYYFNHIDSGVWVTLPMPSSIKKDVVRVTLLFIVYIADYVKVEFKDIDILPGLYIATESLSPITTESGVVLIKEI